MTEVAVVIGVVIAIIIYFVQTFRYWKNRKIVSPPVTSLFGNVSDAVFMRKSLGQIYHQIYNTYPDLHYVGFYRSITPGILIRSPELVKEILVKDFNNFHDNDIHVDEKNDPIMAKNAFASKGELWKEARKQSAPMFTSKRVREMYSLINGCAENVVSYINDQLLEETNGVDAKELCLKYTTDVVANCALGLDANSFGNSDSEYLTMINKLISPSTLNNFKFLFLILYPSLAKNLKIKFIANPTEEWFKTMIRKTIEYRNKNNVRRGDFLDHLVDLQHKLGVDNFSLDDMTAHTVSFFADGTETSAIAVAFILYELGLDIDIQNLLSNEIDEILSKFNGCICYDAIQEMDYLDKVVNEGLRKNTPVPMINRICTKKFILDAQDGKRGGDLIIEPGMPIIISVSGLHHDPKYFPNPSTFDPNRFSTENLEQRPNYTYLPFGEGPRICFGQRFGIAQIKVLLVHIIKKYQVRVNKSTRVPFVIDHKHFMLGALDGIRIDFHKRK